MDATTDSDRASRRPFVLVLVLVMAALVLACVVFFLAKTAHRPHTSGRAVRQSSVASLRIGSTDLAHAGDLARYHYVILHASAWASIPALRAANPKVEVIAYEDMSFSTEGSCADGRDDPYPASGLGYCRLNAGHPGWFLKDTRGDRIQSESYEGLWFMDIGNRAYQNAWAGSVIAVLQAKGFDGVMLDDADSDPSSHLGDRSIAKYPTIRAYDDATRSFLRNVCGRIHAAGFLALPNVDATAPRRVRDEWARPCDGTVKEYWAKWGTSASLQKAGAEWLGDLAQLDDAEATGKIMLPITYGPMSDTRDMVFARASFLLAWNGSDRSALIWDEPGTDSWSPAWTANVGTPISARRRLAGGGWRRDFSKGVVVVNPSASATITVPLGAAYTGAQGASTSSVTLGPSSAAILTAAAGRGASG